MRLIAVVFTAWTYTDKIKSIYEKTSIKIASKKSRNILTTFKTGLSFLVKLYERGNCFFNFSLVFETIGLSILLLQFYLFPRQNKYLKYWV